MEPIRLIRPYISFAEVEEEFRRVFESGIFTKGRNVDGFAQDLCDYTGARHAFLTTSATTALSACLKVLDIGPGDEVIVSDFSFPASANVVEDAGATTVFADVSPTTYNMEPAALEARIGPRTRAVMYVDALGNPSGIDEIARICASRGIPLIEDAACAMGSSVNGVPCGNIANLTCFSFHPRKLLTTGEGGAITTNDERLAARLKVKLNHGGTPGPVAWDFPEFGYNYRMSELQAAMGRVQMRKLDGIVQRRNRMRDEYVAGLDASEFVPQAVKRGVVHNVQSLVFRLPTQGARDAMIEHLKGQGIESTIGTYCLSGGQYYRAKYDDVQPVAAELQATTITLPCYDGVDVPRVLEAIHRAHSLA
jgi:perosamine synthetase